MRNGDLRARRLTAHPLRLALLATSPAARGRIKNCSLRKQGSVRSKVEQLLRAPKKTFARARELRRAMTLPEVVLWQALRKGRLAGLRFRRQHPIGPYILDFYCPSARLGVEVDGFAHDTALQVRHDERRAAWLARRGVSVLRFAARDVLRDETLEGVLLSIEQAACAPSGLLRPPPPPLSGGRNRPSQF